MVTEHLIDSDGNAKNIVDSGRAWAHRGSPPAGSCLSGRSGLCSGGQQFIVQNEPVGPDPAHYTASALVSCQLTLPADGGTCPD